MYGQMTQIENMFEMTLLNAFWTKKDHIKNTPCMHAVMCIEIWSLRFRPINPINNHLPVLTVPAIKQQRILALIRSDKY